MTVQPVFEQAAVRDRINFTAQSIVECKAFRSADEVRKILAVVARAETVGAETVEREVRYSGKVVYDVVYLDAEGAVQRAEVGAEFSHKAERADISSAYSASVVLTLDRTEVRPVNGSLVATSVATAAISLERVLSVPYLTGGEGIVVDRAEREVLRALPSSAVLAVTDEWEIARPVESVLVPAASACVTEVGAGIGCVVADGEISLFLLLRCEDGTLCSDCRRIPFRLEAECADAMPGMAADADVRVKDVRIDATVDGERAAVEATVTLELVGAAYSASLLPVAADAYSPETELELTRSEIVWDRPVSKRSEERRVSGKAAVDGSAAAGAAVQAAIPIALGAAVTQADGGKATVEGVLTACAFTSGGAGADSVLLELPFSLALDAEEIRAGDEVRAEVVPTSLAARILGEAEAEVNAELRVTVTAARKERTEVFSEVAAGEPRAVSDAAISVYLPRPGATLWEVGKDLGVSPETVTEFNPDLQFPLTGAERLVVYRRTAAF